MDWGSALEHLPHRLVVTNRKGRVLLLSGSVPGVRLGRSFLKLAAEADVMTVGRAAKRALKDGEPRTLGQVQAVDGTLITVELIPFASEGADIDHLLVRVGEAEPELEELSLDPSELSIELPELYERPPEPVPTEPAQPAPATAAPELAEQPTAQGETPAMPPVRADGPLPPAPDAEELVIVAAGGTLPLARAFTTVLQDRVKVRAIPVARFVEALDSRVGDRSSAAIDRALSSSTRLLFLGDSPYADDTRATGLRYTEGWAIGGLGVRRAAVWPGPPPTDNPGELVADLQFQMMEVVRRAMPMRRNGRRIQVDPGLERAAAFLEQPAAMDMTGDLMTQARHHQLVIAISRFIQEGLDALLNPRPR